MIQIDNRYLKDEESRNNDNARNEVLACVFVEKYILQNNNILHVGTDPQRKLPDIHNTHNTIGFEVVRCEGQEDFNRKDFIKKLAKINFNYKDYLKIKTQKPNHIFNKVNMKLCVSNNKIVSSIESDINSIDWMIQQYKETINIKLGKLNNGNYKNCKNISLIILNLFRLNGSLNAKQVQQCYFEEAQNFPLIYDYIYYITTIGIFIINTKESKVLKLFTDEEFNECVSKAKQMLQIDEYKK